MTTTTLPWSLFALTDRDTQAFKWLASRSVLVPCSESEVEFLLTEMHEGRMVALSVRDQSTGAYCGLCILAREAPSPWPEKSLSILALSFDSYEPVRPRRRNANNPDILEEVLRFCRTHGYVRLHCYSPTDQDGISNLIRHGFSAEGKILHKQRTYYSWSMDLATPYTGDPRDGAHLLSWLAERLRMEAVAKDDLSVRGHLPLRSVNPQFADRIAGTMELPTVLELKQSRTKSWEVELRFGEAGSGESLAFGRSELVDLTQSDRIDLSDWPPTNETYSLVVEIRRTFFEAYHEGRHAYLDSGHYGTLLTRTLDQGNDSYIFFVDVETTQDNPLLLGGARIEFVDHGSPLAMWRAHGEISSWTDEGSFKRYGSIKRKMTAIVFSDLVKVERRGAGLPTIGHSWAYVPGGQGYSVARVIGLA